MAPQLKHLPPEVAARLREFHGRKQLFRALRIVLTCAIFYAALITVCTHVDRFVFLSTMARQAMFWGVHIAAALLALAGIAWFVRDRTTPRQTAYEVEAALGNKTHEQIVTLENVLSRRTDPTSKTGEITAELVAHLEASTLTVSRGFRAAGLVRDPIAMRLAIVAAACALAFAGLALVANYQFTLMLERFYRPTENLPRPSFIKLEATPNQTILGKGSEAVIQVRVTDQTPAIFAAISRLFGSSQLNCEITLRPWDETKPDNTNAESPGETAKMVRVQRDLYLFTKPDLRASFTYQVRAGTAQTAASLLRVATQPRVLDLKLAATSPAYSNLAEQTISDLSQPQRFLAGTQIEISFRADQPVERVLLRAEKAATPITPEWDSATLTASYKLTLKSPVSFEIELANKLGFTNLDRSTIKLGILEDSAPTVRLDQPPQEIEAIAGSLVEFRGQAEDDLGIGEMAIRFVLNPDPRRESTPREVVIPMSTTGVKQNEFTASLDLEKSGAVPGDTLAVEIRARDSNGADGLSRSTTVRVMPFTRGAEEQRRIAGLRAVGEVIKLLAGKQSDAAMQAPTATLDADAYKPIAKAAGEAGVDLAEEASLQSIFDLLETEHFLTGEPRHQADFRALQGVLLFDGGPLALDAEGGRAALLQADVPVLDRVVTSIVLYRRTRNLMWRLSGMRDEARRLRDMLGELDKPPATKAPATTKPANDALDRINRRGALYMAALQDLGADLIELSKLTGQIKPETAVQLVGDINETGYLLSKGATARRKSAANRIAQQITDAIELARGTLPTLLTRDADARRELAALHAAKLRLIAAGPKTASERWSTAARQWLDMDRLLLEREPFAPFWPRAVDLVLSRHVSGDAKTDVASLLKLNESPTVADERAGTNRVALLWRVQMIAATQNLSEIERSMETTLVAAEAIANSPANPALSAALDAVAKMPVQTSSEAAPVDTAGLLVKATLTSASDRATAQALAQLIEKVLPAGDPMALLKECAAQSDAVAKQLAAMDEALGAGAPTDLPQQVSSLHKALRNELATMQYAVDAMSMQMQRLPGDSVIGDAIVLKLKDQIARYRQRARPTFATLANNMDAPVSATGMGELKSQIGRLRVLHEALQKGVTKLTTEEGASGAASGTAALDRSASLARATLGKGDAGSAKSISAMLGKMDGIGAMVASAHAELIVTAQRAAGDAAREVEAATPDAAKVRVAVAQAKSAVTEFERAASRVGASSVPPAITSNLTAVLADLQSLNVPDALDTATTSRLKFALSDWRRKLDALAGAVRSASVPRDDAGPDFQGGPERAWAIRSGYEAETVRRRLKATGQLADTRAIDGLLSGLDAKPDPAQMDAAYAWAALRYRLDRSELAGFGISRSAQKRTGKVGDPTIEYLKAELGKAKQQQKLLTDYNEATRAYLDLIGDFLLY